MTQLHASLPCPSELLLERLRLGEVAGTSAQAEHLESCPSCQARLAELTAPPPPIDLGKVSRDARRRWPSLPGWLSGRQWIPVMAAGVTALALTLAPPQPDIVIKGPPFTLSLIARTPDGAVRRVDAGARLRAGDRLRFEVFTTQLQAHVAVISLDAEGVVSPLVPAAGDTTAVVGSRSELLAGAVELAGNLGPERIVLVGCDRPMAVSAIVETARVALARAGGDPRQVRELQTGCHEETVWIEKVSR
jgi:hypothetical protein